MNWQEELRGEINISLKLREPLSVHTSFRIGGPADVFAEVGNMEQLKKLVSLCKSRSIPLLIIGRGTNLLVRDKGYHGIVAKLCDDFTLASFDRSSGLITAGAAVPLPRLSRLACKEGLSGLEFAFGIPGSLGGALVTNAGAGSGSICELVDAVEVITQDGDEAVITRDELKFGYRWSNLSEHVCVTKAYLRMKPCQPEEAIDRMNQIFQKKRTEQPLSEASAGCVFKNPPGVSAGRLIDQCGLKGERIGDALVSTRHANFIINVGKATARDVLNLIDRVRSVVRERTGIALELELRIV